MTAAQHRHWQAYIPLIEHTWNTIRHSTLEVSPFEAAHGLPARGVDSHYVFSDDYNAPDYMDKPGIKAMQTTAKAFATHLRQVQMQEAKTRACLLNLKGSAPKLQLGDRVSFYIPPSAEEAELAARKAKHLPQFRGPAVITKIMTPTTFELRYKGRIYKRCLSELRRYRANSEPLLDVGVAPDSATSFEIGSYIAYRDIDDPSSEDSKRFHVGKVTNVADGEAHVHCYATAGKALSHAQWRPLYQDVKGAFTMKKTRQVEAVIDRIPVDEPEWVLHYAVQIGSDARISKRSRRQLEANKVTHHRLRHTF